jgi:(p)ppGpp synthase/HD superfamily hydrolase
MVLTSRFRDALIFAAQLHASQERKGGAVPYVSHLMAVASTVLDNGGDEDEAIAALLHDAIEDQGGKSTREKIRQLFGDRVVDIVNGCTDADTTPKPPWGRRKRRYLKKLRHAAPSVRLVSLADKLHNSRTILADYLRIGDEVWSRFNVGKEDILWYYTELKDIFREQESSLLAKEFVRVVEELVSVVNAGET